MSTTLGVVVPAFRPDPERLRAYLRSVRQTVDPDVVRVELDAPDPGGTDLAVPEWVDCSVVRRRRGKGGAITDGFEALSTDVLAFADADGATPASSLADVVAPVSDGRADLAVGSRRHPDATVESHQTFARRFLGDGFAWIARRLLAAPLYDYQCGAKAIAASAWRDVAPHLYEPGFAWDIELVAVTAALEYRVHEVPVVWEDQPGSTVSPVSDTLDMARGLFVARHRARLLRDDRLHRLLSTDDETALVDRDRTDDDRVPEDTGGVGGE
ncbi:glycosyltransferase [Halobaculum sp. MBLA0147]|uniref:glycosyltransferase n=1 Tax=Halobaculum sp. MBLA0147 TaxID=3079934 RepID=UPI0035231ECE